MSQPTPEDIATAAAQTAADGIATSTVDGRTATAIDPLRQLEVADRLASRESAKQAVSGFAFLKPSQVIPPGSV